MGVTAMDDSQLEQIGNYVKNHIEQWIREQNILNFPRKENHWDRELMDRMVRVEEQLKFQNEKLELMMSVSDKRFESMDKRFEDMQDYMNRRFDSMDKHFEQVNQRFNRVYYFQTGIFLTMLAGFIPLIIKAI